MSVGVPCSKIGNTSRMLKDMDQTAGIHDLHIWSLDEGYHVLTVHVSLKEALPMEQLAEQKKRIRAVLQEENIQHATIEFEMPGEACVFENCADIREA